MKITPTPPSPVEGKRYREGGHFHINFHAGAAPSNDENLIIEPGVYYVNIDL